MSGQKGKHAPEGSAKRETHWADRAAEEIAARGGEAVVATGISPSGHFHVGHLREIITGDALRRALSDRGVKARMVFIVDNVDPLRKVYPFLDAERFKPFVGKPLHEVPAPAGEGSYDDYFLGPFLEALGKLGVETEVVKANELYTSGRMDDVIFTALEKRDVIAAILEEVTKKAVAEDWSPWNPRCTSCGSLVKGVVLGFDRAAGTVHSRCGICGEESNQPAATGGKLTWRVDWAARWAALGVTVEPFGKDHASRGGSYDTGQRFAREVFGIEAPYPMVYEWISLAGKGDMSASKGNVLSVAEMLEVVPPEVLRYLVLKARPTKTVTFDPGRPLGQLLDEVDDASARGRDDRALELSRAAGFKPVGVPFHHVVLVAQLAEYDIARVLEMLHEGHYEGLDPEAVEARVKLARGWLERFAPEDQRIEVTESLTEGVAALSAEQKAYLGQLAEKLPGLSEAGEIHQLVYGLAKAEGGPGPKPGFQAIYQALLGRDRGPKAATFIAALGTERVAKRLAEASQA